MHVRVTATITVEHEVDPDYIAWLEDNKRVPAKARPEQVALELQKDYDSDASSLLENEDLEISNLKVERIADAAPGKPDDPKAGQKAGGGSDPAPGGSKKT